MAFVIFKTAVFNRSATSPWCFMLTEVATLLAFWARSYPKIAIINGSESSAGLK